MTIACVLVHNREVWLGSDRQVTFTGRGEKTSGPPKWTVSNDRQQALACSGAKLAGDLIRENAEDLFKSTQQGGARSLWRALGAVFRQHGWEPYADKEDPPSWDLDLLYVVRSGMIMHVSRNGSIRVVPDPFYATGSGDAYALGAFHGLQPTDADAQTRVLAAVTAACRYDLGCGGEPWVEQL